MKHDAERLWRKLAELRDGKADEVLGYKTWHAYCAAEFDIGKSRSYQLLDAGRVARALDSTIVERVINEGQARELAPLRDDHEAIREVWTEVVATHSEPTAADVRAAVSRRKPARSTKPQPPAHYLTDLVSDDAADNLRTQLVLWFEQGRTIETLLKSKAPLVGKSAEDVRSLKHDADLMVRVATHVKKELS
jgi:hypothetical protein